MNCPSCNEFNTGKIFETRKLKVHHEFPGVEEVMEVVAIWRRRRCTICQFNYTSWEVIDYYDALKRLDKLEDGVVPRRGPGMCHLRAPKGLPDVFCGHCGRTVDASQRTHQNWKANRCAPGEGCLQAIRDMSKEELGARLRRRPASDSRYKRVLQGVREDVRGLRKD